MKTHTIEHAKKNTERLSNVTSKTKKPVKKSEIIDYVEWDDHFSTNGRWMDPEDVKTSPLKNCSVGKVVKEDRKVVCLSPSWSENGMVTDTITILKNCITKRKTIG